MKRSALLALVILSLSTVAGGCATAEVGRNPSSVGRCADEANKDSAECREAEEVNAPARHLREGRI